MAGNGNVVVRAFSSLGQKGKKFSRAEFAAVFITLFILSVLVSLFSQMITGVPDPAEIGGNPIMFIWGLIVMVINIIASVRRLKDLNWSAWLVLLFLVPIANLVLLLLLLFKKGTS